MHIYNESYATSIMFIGGVVETLCNWKINLARIGIMHVEDVPELDRWRL
tara:strand:+ start:102 stop:248 length:147 start_codon:yes stop_codon:yes gene_type:complete